MALALFWKNYGAWVKWCALAALVVFAWLYVTRLQNTRDAALNNVATLQKTLDIERSAAKAMADAKVAAAQVASTAATLQVVQKKREIAQHNHDLKQEINHVYAIQTHATATDDAAQAAAAVGDGATNERHEDSENNQSRAVQRPMGSNFGLNAGCFGGDFKRLWNAANTGAGGVPSATTP